MDKSDILSDGQIVKPDDTGSICFEDQKPGAHHIGTAQPSKRPRANDT